MESKGLGGVSEFGAFDKNPNKQYWLAVTSKKKNGRLSIQSVYVFAFSFYRAQMAALIALQTERHLVEMHRVEGKTTLAAGTIVFITDEGSVTDSFTVTGATTCEAVGRDYDAGEWEPVALESGCDDEDDADGVQEDGQETVHPQTNGASEDPGGGHESREDPRLPG